MIHVISHFVWQFNAWLGYHDRRALMLRTRATRLDEFCWNLYSSSCSSSLDPLGENCIILKSTSPILHHDLPYQLTIISNYISILFAYIAHQSASLRLTEFQLKSTHFNVYAPDDGRSMHVCIHK